MKDLVRSWSKLGGVWNTRLDLNGDQSCEECSANMGFSGGQSDTYRGTWKLLPDGNVEVHYTEKEYDLDYGSASDNDQRKCDFCEVWTVIRDEAGNPIKLKKGDTELT